MRLFPLLLTGMAAVGCVTAQTAVPADSLEALVRDSPFLPPAGAARAAVGSSGPLELRGIVFEGGQYSFSIYDQGSRESKWVRLGQDDLPFVPRSFDREQDILTVEHQGRTLALKLQPAHLAGQPPPGSVSAPPPLPSAEEAARAGGIQPAPPASGPGDPAAPAPPSNAKREESQRLQELADEVRRRRQPVQTSP